MIFLPNKAERFCFSLRNYIHRKTLISPITKKQRQILRKIHLAEAVCFDTRPIPLDIIDYAVGLLTAIQIIKVERKEKFKFSVNVIDNYLIDIRPFEILLLILSQKSRYISIYNFNKRLIIEAQGYYTNIEGLLKKLDAISLYEVKNNRVYIIISASATTKKQGNIKKEWEQICDPFSSVNLFLSE